MMETFKDQQLETVTAPGYHENLSEVVAEIRRSVDGLLELGRKDDQDELLPGEMRQLTFNRQLLQEIARNMPTILDDPSFAMRINQSRGIVNLAQFLGSPDHASNAGYYREPTGSGKTVLFGVITKALQTKTVIFVPRKNLLTQTKRDLVETVGIPEDDIGLFGGKWNELEDDRRILICLYQSLARTSDPENPLMQDLLGRSLVICDEAHRSLGAGTRAALGRLGLKGKQDRFAADPRLFLAFTATTELLSKSVSDLFPELIAEESHGDMVDAGILVDYVIHKSQPSVLFLDELAEVTDEEAESAIHEREKTYEKLILKFLDLKSTTDEPLFPVAFCRTHVECDKFKKIAARHGLTCSIVTGYEQNADEAVQQLAEDDLLSGKTDILITVDLLGESWDFPPANVAIMARASQSPRVLIQNSGRVARAFDSTVSARFKDRLHKPYRKERAHVLEADWTVQIRKGRKPKKITDPGAESPIPDAAQRRKTHQKPGQKPLDLAGALASVGEDPRAFVSSGDGKEIVTTQVLVPDEDGRAEYEWAIVITPPDYAKLPEKKLSLSQLQDVIILGSKRGSLRCVPNVRIAHRRSVLVFREDDLDLAVREWREAASKRERSRQRRREALQTIPWNILDEKTDEASIEGEDGRIAIGLRGIVALLESRLQRTSTQGNLRDSLAAENVFPVPYRTARLFQSARRRDPTPARALAFWKDVVLEKLPSLLVPEYRLDPMTDETAITAEGGRIAIGLQGILRIPEVAQKQWTASQLRNVLASKKVRKVPHRIVRVHEKAAELPQVVPAFWKDDITGNLTEILKPRYALNPETHDTVIPGIDGGRTAITMPGILSRPEIRGIALQPDQIRQWIRDRITPIGGLDIVLEGNREIGAGHRRPVTTYWWDEVLARRDELMKLLLDNSPITALKQPDGSFVIDDKKTRNTVKASSLKVFAKQWNLDLDALRTVVERERISPLDAGILSQISQSDIRKSGVLFEQKHLLPYLSLLARADGTVDLPYLVAKGGVAPRAAITKHACAEALQKNPTEIADLIRSFGVCSVDRTECIQFSGSSDATSAVVDVSRSGHAMHVRWRDEGEKYPVLVHVSAAEISEVYWLDEIERALENDGAADQN